MPCLAVDTLNYFRYRNCDLCILYVFLYCIFLKSFLYIFIRVLIYLIEFVETENKCDNAVTVVCWFRHLINIIILNVFSQVLTTWLTKSINEWNNFPFLSHKFSQRDRATKLSSIQCSMAEAALYFWLSSLPDSHQNLPSASHRLVCLVCLSVSKDHTILQVYESYSRTTISL